jgi:hypothetical protein
MSYECRMMNGRDAEVGGVHSSFIIERRGRDPGQRRGGRQGQGNAKGVLGSEIRGTCGTGQWAYEG